VTPKVYLIGAGPGSVDLLTLKAARLLASADVVLHDALVCQEVLDVAPQARKILVGKRAGAVSTDQAFINRLLITSAKGGGVVVRLKGGDPMIFGRAHEEIEACRRAGIDVEIVPGITAASAAAAQIGTSLTRRGVSRSLALITPSSARGAPDDRAWADLAVASQTSSIYMGATHATDLRDTLIGRGLNPTTPIVIVHDVSRPQAGHVAGHLIDLVELAHGLGSGPTILLLGEVFADLVSVTGSRQSAEVRQA
jgi:uroporphyrin-III C-methyltransferase